MACFRSAVMCPSNKHACQHCLSLPRDSIQFFAAPQKGHKMYGTITKSVATAPLET